MLKYPVILLFLSLLSFSMKAQSDSLFMPVKVITGEIIDFTVDNLGYYYILYQNGQLKKLTPAGDSVAVFNNVRRYGQLHQIDVTNPLKILLYYRDFGTVLILDRLLGTRATIDLRRQALFQVKAVGLSYDNNIWVFDEQESKLKRIGDDGKVLYQSTDFRILFDSMPTPQSIIDNNKQLYLYDSTKGVYIFDYYGSFRNRLPFTGWSDFTVINKILFGRQGDILYRYEPGTLDLRKMQIPAAIRGSKKIVISPASLYSLDKDGIRVFSYN